MPIQIKDLDGGIGNLICGTGVITDEEYVASLKKHLSQSKEKFEKYIYSFVDVTSATEVNVSTQSIYQIASLCKAAAKNNRHALVAVVASQDLIYGLARMSQVLMEETGWQHEVFRNREDAEAWLRTKAKERFGISDLTIDST